MPTSELIISRIKAKVLELNTSKKIGNNLFVKGKFNKRNNAVNNDQSEGSGTKGKNKKE